jgi:hypothetical protein
MITSVKFMLNKTIVHITTKKYSIFTDTILSKQSSFIL